MMTEARREEIREIIAQLAAAKDAIWQVSKGIDDDNRKMERELTEAEVDAKRDSEEEDFTTLDIDGAMDDIQRAIDSLERAADYRGGEYYKHYNVKQPLTLHDD